MDNRHKITYKKPHRNIRKKLIARVVKCWNWLPGEVVQSPFLKVFKPDWTWC